MAEESDLEKTEQPSARRLEQAREEGQVPHSRELGTFLVLFAGVMTLLLAGEWMGRRWVRVLADGFAFEHDTAFDPVRVLWLLRRVFVESANKNTDSAGKSACRLPDAGSPGGSVNGH